MPLAFMPKVRPRVLPTSFSSSEPTKVRRSLNITFLAECLKSHEGLARELKTLPVVHLNENGLQLVFARTIEVMRTSYMIEGRQKYELAGDPQDQESNTLPYGRCGTLEGSGAPSL